MTEILSAKQMRDSDIKAIDGNESTSRELMYKASLGVYNSVSWHGKIGIVCGSGNNGGDGYALALILKEKGFLVDVISALGTPKESTTAYYYYKKWINTGTILYASTSLEEYDILVDAIFGTGFTGKENEQVKDIIARYNSSGAYKVSIDINSGLSSDTGLGEDIACSDLTVSIGSYKLGHFLNQSRDAIKELINVDIGINPVGSTALLFEAEDAKNMLTERKSYSYKGTYGTATIMGGCTEYTGATKLASISASAIRAGCGISRLAVPRSIVGAVTPYLLDSTLYSLSDENGAIKYNNEEIDFLINNSTVILYGIGTTKNENGIKIVRKLLNDFSGILILDAGGLRCLAELDISEIKGKSCSLVLTPHLGEMKALYSGYSIPTDVIAYAKSIDATVLLKGNATIISNGEKTLISTTGCAGMAKGGSGDVLSGIIAGLCASIKDLSALTNTVALGAFINGVAGELAQKELCDISMCASDTAFNVGKAIAKIKE